MIKPDYLAAAAQNLDRWAEITALAIDLRKAVLAQSVSEEEAEARVWAEILEMKEAAWIRTPS